MPLSLFAFFALCVGCVSRLSAVHAWDVCRLAFRFLAVPAWDVCRSSPRLWADDAWDVRRLASSRPGCFAWDVFRSFCQFCVGYVPLSLFAFRPSLRGMCALRSGYAGLPWAGWLLRLLAVPAWWDVCRLASAPFGRPCVGCVPLGFRAFRPSLRGMCAAWLLACCEPLRGMCAAWPFCLSTLGRPCVGCAPFGRLAPLAMPA